MLVYVRVLGYTSLNSSKSIGAFGGMIIDCDHQCVDARNTSAQGTSNAQ
jgi:hypothetical protein